MIAQRKISFTSVGRIQRPAVRHERLHAERQARHLRCAFPEPQCLHILVCWKLLSPVCNRWHAFLFAAGHRDRCLIPNQKTHNVKYRTANTQRPQTLRNLELVVRKLAKLVRQNFGSYSGLSANDASWFRQCGNTCDWTVCLVRFEGSLWCHTPTGQEHIALISQQLRREKIVFQKNLIVFYHNYWQQQTISSTLKTAKYQLPLTAQEYSPVWCIELLQWHVRWDTGLSFCEEKTLLSKSAPSAHFHPAIRLVDCPAWPCVWAPAAPRWNASVWYWRAVFQLN